MGLNIGPRYDPKTLAGQIRVLFVDTNGDIRHLNTLEDKWYIGSTGFKAVLGSDVTINAIRDPTSGQVTDISVIYLGAKEGLKEFVCDEKNKRNEYAPGTYRPISSQVPVDQLPQLAQSTQNSPPPRPATSLPPLVAHPPFLASTPSAIKRLPNAQVPVLAGTPQSGGRLPIIATMFPRRRGEAWQPLRGVIKRSGCSSRVRLASSQKWGLVIRQVMGRSGFRGATFIKSQGKTDGALEGLRKCLY